MSSATTPRQVRALLEGLRQKLETEAAATHDATFIQHANKLSADFAELLARAQAGEDTSTVEKALAEDGTTLGVDCGMAGWTP